MFKQFILMLSMAYVIWCVGLMLTMIFHEPLRTFVLYGPMENPLVCAVTLGGYFVAASNISDWRWG